NVPLNGVITYTIDGEDFAAPMNEGDHWPIIGAVVRHLRGDTTAPKGTLEMARAHTLLVNATSEAAAVASVPERAKQSTGSAVVIPGIEEALKTCVARRQTLHETKLFDWTHPTTAIGCADYSGFAGPAAGGAS
ncbi:MAG TPA: hypothetical protein VF624_14835, partial [Tepidisphaeraceae bacterium]